MFKKLFPILSLLASFLLAAPAAALEPGDVVMSLKPSEQDVELTPGETYHGSVAVSNIGRLPFDIHTSVSPYYVNSDNYDPDFSVESSYTKIHNWIKLDQETYHIEPNSFVDVTFTIDVPADVPGGGQYAAIMLTADPGEEDSGAMKITSQLAAIIYGHIAGGQLKAEGELVEHFLPNFLFNSDLSVSQTIKNTGNVDFKVVQKLTITNFFTNQDAINPDSVSEDGQYLGYSVATVLPGTSRTGILTWKDAPRLGLFRVTQEISFLDQNLTFSKLVLICPIWLMVIVIAAIIALIVLLVLKIKKKLQSKKTEVI